MCICSVSELSEIGISQSPNISTVTQLSLVEKLTYEKKVSSQEDTSKSLWERQAANKYLIKVLQNISNLILVVYSKNNIHKLQASRANMDRACVSNTEGKMKKSLEGGGRSHGFQNLHSQLLRKEIRNECCDA